MNQKTIQEILKQVKDNYEQTAEEFNQTRSYLWPGLQSLKKFVKNGDKVLDLGCGNGKLRLLFKDYQIDYFGVDNSKSSCRL